MQSRFQSPCYPCPAEWETFPASLDKGNEGSGNEIARDAQNVCVVTIVGTVLNTMNMMN